MNIVKFIMSAGSAAARVQDRVAEYFQSTGVLVVLVPKTFNLYEIYRCLSAQSFRSIVNFSTQNLCHQTCA